jgi:hypothetical protein
MGDRWYPMSSSLEPRAANAERRKIRFTSSIITFHNDCKWYLTNQLSKPCSIFEPIIADVAKSLLEGVTLRRSSFPLQARRGSLMMFAVRSAQCVGCKAVSTRNRYVLYKTHSKEAEIYLSKHSTRRELRYTRALVCRAGFWDGAL